MKKILILTNALSANPKDDELDVLEQAALVEEACRKLGYETSRMEMGLDLGLARNGIRQSTPDLVFNLVESLDNQGEFAYLAPSLLSSLRIPYTGSPVIPMLLSSNKVLAKKELRQFGLLTPPWFLTHETRLLDPASRYILKPIWEEGSLELDEEQVFRGYDEAMKQRIAGLSPEHYFIETFINGREFNISLLASPEGPEVLPVAEMEFLDYPEGKPRVMGYRSKWHEDSFEYTHTTRTFIPRTGDQPLYRRLAELCRETWRSIGLRGYARIDFRISEAGDPYIIDINANPCLSLSGGFTAAAQQAGYQYDQVIHRILEDAITYR